MNINNAPSNEDALIAALLHNPQFTLPLCLKSNLTELHFKNPNNVRIYKTALELHNQGVSLDAILLLQKLPNLFDHIDNLTALPVCYSNAPFFIENILKEFETRQLTQIATSILNSSFSPEQTEQFIEQIQDKINFIRQASKYNSIFQPITWPQLENYQPPPDANIAGLGWLRRCSGTLLTGGTGIGKSVLATQIAASVATGRDILNLISVPRPLKVLYIQAENDEETLKRDISAILNHVLITDKHPKENIIPALNENLIIYHIFGLGYDFQPWLLRQVCLHLPDLVIIDPYQSFLPPDADINSTACFLSFIQSIQQAMFEYRFALLLVAHTPKPRDRENWTARESVYLAAGSSAIANWARASAELTQTTDTEDRYRLRFGKNAERNGLIASTTGGVLRDLFIVHSGSIHTPYWRVADNQNPSIITDKGKEIVECALQHPDWNYRQIADACRCSKALVSKYYPTTLQKANPE